ncbi:MAG: T9SS type A sorting domain-containing protein [Saprospiraceae bacterium]|nr:T9SS type A sorting domain-containing protein [Saprospiraceae bacterium]
MRSKYIFLIVMLLLMNSSGTFAQRYLSKFVNLDFLPNTRTLLYEDGKYIVSSINFIDDVSTSTIIELDENFDTIRTINHSNVLFSRKSPQKYNGSYYAYAADETTNRQTHLLVEMDENFDEIKRDTFYPDGNTHNANSMTMVDDKIIGAAWDYYDCPELSECTFMNYKVISTAGKELQSFNVEEEEPYFFSFEVDYTADSHIICGGNRYELPFAKASVHRSTQEGTILWNYDSPHRQSRGNVPVWIEELSDGNIVYTDKLDKLDDDDYLDLGYTNRPAELVWLSPDGDLLFSYLDTVNWTSSTEFHGVQKGKGDYFFVYGDYYYNNLEPTEFDGSYGFLMKFTNEGEVKWRRLYKHSDDPYGEPLIRQIYEHENGDIVILGREVNDNGYFMWMMRVNENGCLGDDGCDDPLILPVDEVQTPILNTAVKVYPNPAMDILNFDLEESYRVIAITVLDTYGNPIRNFNEIFENRLNISFLNSGIYFLKISMSDHTLIYKKFIKQ